MFYTYLKEKIIIIGAGITGLTIAKELSEKLGSRVVVLEKEDYLGGLAASFTRDTIFFDCGSHRLHIDAKRDICDYITSVTKAPLLRRQRQGRLVYRGKFIKYPPAFFNLLRCFSGREMLSFLGGFLKQRISSYSPSGHDFESTMIRTSGRRFYEAFFKNYAGKLWGVDPSTISAEAKRKRTVFNYKMLCRSIFSGKHYYLYPRDGIGSIAAGLEKNILASGARIMTSSRISDITLRDNKVAEITVSDGRNMLHTMKAAALISTIPLDDLYGMVFKNLNGHRLMWRGARMVHALLDRKLDGNCETFYCPDSDICIGRVSEINKYSPGINASLPGSFLTIEIPASSDDSLWAAEDEALLEHCLQDLVKAKIADKKTRITKSFYARLKKVYPLYLMGWENPFEHIYGRLNSIANLYTVGRMGLFLHCNIDHCIEQGLAMAGHILTCHPSQKEQWHARTKQFMNFSARD